MFSVVATALDYGEGRVLIWAVKSSIREAAVRQSISAHCYCNDTRSSAVIWGSRSDLDSTGDSMAVVSIKPRLQIMGYKHSNAIRNNLKQSFLL